MHTCLVINNANWAIYRDGELTRAVTNGRGIPFLTRTRNYVSQAESWKPLVISVGKVLRYWPRACVVPWLYSLLFFSVLLPTDRRVQLGFRPLS